MALQLSLLLASVRDLFRALITDAYSYRCAITREQTLPVLQAAHIRPYADGGSHELSNGLLLRSDLHTLFDQHYITIEPNKRTLIVSRRIREQFCSLVTQQRDLQGPNMDGRHPSGASFGERHR